MNEQELRDAIYESFYRIARIGQKPEQSQFFDSVIKDTWPTTPPPATWPKFWYQAIAVEIQHALIGKGKYLNGFDGAWLEGNKNKKWEALYAWAASDLMDYEDAVGGNV